MKEKDEDQINKLAKKINIIIKYYWANVFENKASF